ncbi:hypothetical protein D3C71_1391880 [compost metagenome]
MDDGLQCALRFVLQFQYCQTTGPYRGATVPEAGELEAIFDQRHGAVEGGDHGIGVTEKHRRAGGGIGDVHHRHIEQFLQAFTAVLAVAGLDHGVERLVVGHHPVHDRDGRQVTLEIAFDGVGTEVRGEADDFRAG